MKGCTCQPPYTVLCALCAHYACQAERALPTLTLSEQQETPTPYVAYASPWVARINMPDDTINETALQTKVRKAAKNLGWESYHTYDSRRSDEGFPDLVLVKAGKEPGTGRLIFAELKSRTGKLSAEQETWLSLLRHSVASVEVYCWKPADWETIVHILRAKEPPCPVSPPTLPMTS